jgi:hypothetical protein
VRVIPSVSGSQYHAKSGTLRFWKLYMNDVLWYSRLAVWMGCVILLAQSIANHGTNYMTLIGVVALTAGFGAFIAALSWQGLGSWAPVGVGAHEPSGTEDATLQSAEISMASPSASESVSPMPRDEASSVARPAAVEADTGSETLGQTGPDTATLDPSPGPVSVHSDAEATNSPRSIVTIDVSDSSPERGEQCPQCEKPLTVGELAAGCNVCGRAHHAACWTTNHFHCAVTGCSGQGNLSAPVASTRTGDES